MTRYPTVQQYIEYLNVRGHDYQHSWPGLDSYSVKEVLAGAAAVLAERSMASGLAIEMLGVYARSLPKSQQSAFVRKAVASVRKSASTILCGGSGLARSSLLLAIGHFGFPGFAGVLLSSFSAAAKLDPLSIGQFCVALSNAGGRLPVTAIRRLAGSSHISVLIAFLEVLPSVLSLKQIREISPCLVKVAERIPMEYRALLRHGLVEAGASVSLINMLTGHTVAASEDEIFYLSNYRTPFYFRLQNSARDTYHVSELDTFIQYYLLELSQRRSGRLFSFPCPCCGYLTFDYPLGSMQTCVHCGWFDDLFQAMFVDFAPGGNALSLRAAQRQYLKHGAPTSSRCQGRHIATSLLCRADGWHPLGPARRSVKKVKYHFVGNAAALDPVAGYYWCKS